MTVPPSGPADGHARPIAFPVMDPDAPKPDSPDLQQWTYEQLRRAAFDRAKERRDVGFFVSLMEHTSAMTKTVDEGGSLGEIGGTIAETVEAAQQLFGREGVGELEPMYRAVFIDYLRSHPAKA